MNINVKSLGPYFDALQSSWPLPPNDMHYSLLASRFFLSHKTSAYPRLRPLYCLQEFFCIFLLTF
jgi:hypothetical protein